MGPRTAESQLRQKLAKLDSPWPEEPKLTREQLLAYHVGELSDREEQFLRERLSWDPESVRFLLKLQSQVVDAPESQENRAGDERPQEEIAEDWEAIQEMLNRTPEAEQPPIQGQAHRSSSKSEPVLPPPALKEGWMSQALVVIAAGLAFLSVGLGWQVQSLQRQLQTLSQPAHLLVVALAPVDNLSIRSADPQAQIAITPDLQKIGLLLEYSGFESFDSYRAEIERRTALEGARSKDLFVIEDLLRTPEGGFGIELGGDRLRPSMVEIRLIGLEKSESRLLATYQVELR